MIRVHLQIRGHVQGVWFRASTQDLARELGLRGWVRNRRDGSVEAVAEGPEDSIDRFVAWCHEGPVGARVDRVEVHRLPPADLPEGFHVRPTV